MTDPSTHQARRAASLAGIKQQEEAVSDKPILIDTLAQDAFFMRRHNEELETQVTQQAAKVAELEGLRAMAEPAIATLKQQVTQQAATIAEVREERDQVRDALEMLYDKYEDGPSCTENGDSDGSYLGNAVRLDGPEEDAILKLIRPERVPNLVAQQAATIAKLEKSEDELMTERDEAIEAADGIAYEIFTVEQIGEHSNLNNPWEQARILLHDLNEQVTQQAATLTKKQETIDGLFAEVDKFQQIIIKNEPVWLGSGYSPAQCLRLALESTAQKSALAQQAATISQLQAVVRLFRDRIEAHGEWDDGCFYYNKCSASELQEPLQGANVLLAPKPFSRSRRAALASLPK